MNMDSFNRMIKKFYPEILCNEFRGKDKMADVAGFRSLLTSLLLSLPSSKWPGSQSERSFSNMAYHDLGTVVNNTGNERSPYRSIQ